MKKSDKIRYEYQISDKYNSKRINYSSGKDDWNRFEENNPATTLNVLYVKKMNIYPTYISKHNLNHEDQIMLLMIPNGEEWHYLAVKNLSALLRGITFYYRRACKRFYRRIQLFRRKYWKIQNLFSSNNKRS